MTHKNILQKIIIFGLFYSLIFSFSSFGLSAMTDTIETDFEYDVIEGEFLGRFMNLTTSGNYTYTYPNGTVETTIIDPEFEIDYTLFNVTNITIIDSQNCTIEYEIYQNNTNIPEFNNMSDWGIHYTSTDHLTNTKESLIESYMYALPNDVFCDDIVDNDLYQSIMELMGLLPFDLGNFTEEMEADNATVYRDELTINQQSIPYRILYDFVFHGDVTYPDDDIGINLTINSCSDIFMNEKHIFNDSRMLIEATYRMFQLSNTTIYNEVIMTGNMINTLEYDSIDTDPTPENPEYEFEDTNDTNNGSSDLATWWDIYDIYIYIVLIVLITLAGIYIILWITNAKDCQHGKPSLVCKIIP